MVNNHAFITKDDNPVKVETHDNVEPSSTIDLICSAIDEKCSVVIEYRNSTENLMWHYLTSIKFSKNHGKEYIIAYSLAVNKELQFKIERIQSLSIIPSVIPLKDLLCDAVEKNDTIKILLRNDDGILRTYHVEDYESKEGEIICYCRELQKNVNIEIDAIVFAETIWRILSAEEWSAQTILQDGIYVFYCMADNHSVYEMYNMRKGDRFNKYFTGKYEHVDGWNTVFPIAYHYVPYYLFYMHKWKTDEWFKENEMAIFSYLKDGTLEYGFIDNQLHPEHHRLLYEDDIYWDRREIYWDDIRKIGLHKFVPFSRIGSIPWWNRYFEYDNE